MQAIIDGRRKDAPGLVQQCLEAGESAGAILENHFVRGMMIIARAMKKEFY